MQFIDKTLNRVIKWENKNISISEMLNLIESEIIEKSSDKDLMSLEKGMYKTWVLGVGSFTSLRYFPSAASPVRLCFNFNVFTHNIQQITLQDTTNKVEYFIPRGKEPCKKLQRGVLRRIARYKGDGAETGHISGQGGRFLNQKKSSGPMKWVGRCVLGIAVALVVLVTALNLSSAGDFLGGLFSDTPKWVSTVQNGYLGEFTDMTVYDLLGIHRSFYEKEIWDGGTTDNGDRIAEVRFSSRQSPDTVTIQFVMLNDEVFRVSAYVDTQMPGAQRSDVAYALIASYYSRITLEYLDDDEKTAQLNALLREVDASEILYGASAGFTGDRATLYQMGNDSLLGLTASELMEYHGLPLTDTPSYDFSENTQPATETTVSTLPAEEIVLESYVQTQESDTYDTSVTLTGTVLWSSGGLKVHSGPGTNYAEIRKLEPGAAVTISEQQNVNGTYWGKIYDGWICMEYVDVGDQESVSDNGSSTSVSMTVCVKLSAGELKIRSGPDTSYHEVGRALGGETFTVTELQQSGGKQWGRIPQGWICMDYVDTVYGTQNEWSNAQRFVGNWQDQNSQRCGLTIEPGEDDGTFVIEISWGNSAFSTSMWRALGEYDANSDCIQYHDCDHWESVSDGNGNFTNNYYYTGGQGTFYFSGGNLLWEEYNESTGSRCSFVKLS